MEEFSNRKNINMAIDWTEKHSLKITSKDHDVQKMLDRMNIVTVYEYPPIRRKYPRSNFEE